MTDIMGQHIYIDVSSFMSVSFVTGIQRVVKSVILEMSDEILNRTRLIYYSGNADNFWVLPTDAFISALKGIEDMPAATSIISPLDMVAGDIFFDLDSVWNLNYKRSRLLPKLKNAGVKIAVYVYDIIPITHPQYCHELTCYNFITYIGAHLMYADIIIASAQTTLDEIYKLQDYLSLPHTLGYVSWLGADFIAKEECTEEDIPDKVKEAAQGKFILAVGTIEPRKNHNYLLDAFDYELFEKGYKLIFVGRRGWNVDELFNRINKEKQKGKKFFYFDNLNDEAVDYLYRHAYAVAFPTMQEGFGLPIVEALLHKVPVFASDIPILREVGKDFCVYFDNSNYHSFVNLLEEYSNEPDKYKELCRRITSFSPVSWKTVSENIISALNSLSPVERKPKQAIKQMMILTAREEAVGETLKFVDYFMPFIYEVILVCPDNKKNAMLSSYTGRLSIKALTDSEVLQGKTLPEDHGKRNFKLRCCAMQNDILDEVFLMSDDDYRPLRMIDESVFVTKDYYRAYYFYDLSKWKPSLLEISSFDFQQLRTKDFLCENHYPCKQYASHMPQVIDRDIYREMICEYPNIEDMGLCEWDSYFNYAQYMYPDLIHSEPYVTMNWPASQSDWKKEVFPSEYLFENFYENLYEKGQIFEGFSPVWTDRQIEENSEKIKMIEKMERINRINSDMFGQFVNRYEIEQFDCFNICFGLIGNTVNFSVPKVIEVNEGSISYIPLYIGCEKEVVFCYSILDSLGNMLLKSTPVFFQKKAFRKPDDFYNFPVVTESTQKIDAGTYRVVFEAVLDSNKYKKETVLEIK